MALSSSVPLPFTCPKVKIGSSSSFNFCLLGGNWSARSCASLFNRRPLRTATTAIEAVPKQESPPWLMLPPELESGSMNYKLYNLADNKVETLCPSDAIRELPISCCRGSTHGWLALLGYDTCILYNPISRRHIKLPSILNLPRMPKQNDTNTVFSDITKLILTCSPDEENCLAFIINNWSNALAFCWPGRSKEWTMMMDENNNRDQAKRFYEDFVYSPRLKLFFALTDSRKIETWDFGEPSSPKLIKVDKCYFDSSLERWLKCMCAPNEYLVFAGEDILYVIQYAMEPVGPDGSYIYKNAPDNCPYVTIRFDVLKYDRKKGKFKYVDGSSSSCLGGYAIFVGPLSHSVAIPATRFPELLKPDSIYFTDGYFEGTFDGDYKYPFDDERVVGHDIGIYNYQDKTVSPCYYPCDVRSLKKILPPPIWFFPN
ncbi:hypothetical protein CASFOL_030178 [Castilleja foliolosa]|uniref:KIB1-4 beta-propeller domain-containing protein n=1 Tax=Castilleja foliolosa TaxID=1961234 RepID=A0ABD3CB93_9LAMI